MVMLPLVASILLAHSGQDHATTIDGKQFELSGAAATVVVFIASDCPIANDAQPALERVYQKYKDRDVRMAGVYIDPRLMPEDLAKHKKEYRFHYEQILDAEHALVKRLGAKITPEAFVLNVKGEVQYRGRINDAYADLGVRRAVKSNDLDVAIAAVLDGKKPDPARTEAFGCAIPDLADFR